MKMHTNLLVRKHQQHSISELIFVQHTMKLITSLRSTISVVGVDHEDQPLGVLEIMAPERANLVLPANIPNSEVDVLVFDSLHVEADGGDGGHNLAELQLIQNRGLARSVKPNHENTHLLLREEALENTAEVAHFESADHKGSALPQSKCSKN